MGLFPDLEVNNIAYVGIVEFREATYQDHTGIAEVGCAFEHLVYIAGKGSGGVVSRGCNAGCIEECETWTDLIVIALEAAGDHDIAGIQLRCVIDRTAANRLYRE